MSGAFTAGLRCVVVGLLVLAMLVVPFAPSATPALAAALSGPCGHSAGTTGAGAIAIAIHTAHPDASPCGGAAEPTTPSGAMDRTCCPDPDGRVASGNGCMAMGCHAMPASLSEGAAPLPVHPPSVAVTIPAIVLLDGIAVDPALKPPRSAS